MVLNVNVNVDLCFRLSCELVGWLTISGFPVNLLGDWLLINTKRWKLSTTQVVGEGKSGSWVGARTKGEVHECEFTKYMFFHSYFCSCVLKNPEDNWVLPWHHCLLLFKKIALRTNEIIILSDINQSYCIIHTFDLRWTLPKYLRTLFHKNASMMIGLTNQ